MNNMFQEKANGELRIKHMRMLLLALIYKNCQPCSFTARVELRCFRRKLYISLARNQPESYISNYQKLLIVVRIDGWSVVYAHECELQNIPGSRASNDDITLGKISLPRQSQIIQPNLRSLVLSSPLASLGVRKLMPEIRLFFITREFTA